MRRHDGPGGLFGEEGAAVSFGGVEEALDEVEVEGGFTNEKESGIKMIDEWEFLL